MTEEWYEYEFDLPDGTKRYEIVCKGAGYSSLRQVTMFMEMHKAVNYRLVRNTPIGPDTDPAT